MQPGRAALVVLAAVLYTLGWSVGMVATVLVAAARAGWYGLAWAFSAVRVGWEDARARSG